MLKFYMSTLPLPEEKPALDNQGSGDEGSGDDVHE
jgi:hypothetical protein